ncbi:THAP domain-containing protein 4-like isoform X3 [Ostrinia furnacalis]|uniref:THAP domain-containing protein 4-like isoform X3 n=1 Tax=Ostrinia furnacalis TaxID=93504 RepID=UPI00103B6877|nr:THAP domain-containing protein 4-like isoform X3 [Ostrinia furnacalis]
MVVPGRSLRCVLYHKNMSCVIDGCDSHSGRKENSGEKIHFHSFPKVEKIKVEWIRRVGRPDWKWKTYSRICSKHFSPDNYLHSEYSTKRRLKFQAVPSINLSEADSISSERGLIHSIPSAVQGQGINTVTSEHGHVQCFPSAVTRRALQALEGQENRSSERGHNDIHSIPSAVQGQGNITTSEHGHVQCIPSAVTQRALRELEGQEKRKPLMEINTGIVSIVKRKCSSSDKR